jgi:1-deoxy-D-xylulose-5-phosphate reductoisomerase
MVLAGDLVLQTAENAGTAVIPVDSEHSAISQLCRRFTGPELDSLVLTASGGALRNIPVEKLDQVKPEDALRHPTWNMGRKITIDSASMANKGLEVIEACRFFKVPPGKVTVVIHPQSKIHSMIRTVDGVLYAQISDPDMSVALQNAYTYPEITGPQAAYFDLSGTSLTFEEVDYERYPMLKLAYSAAEANDSSIIYNGANEIAVAAFLQGKIKFTQIYDITRRVLEKISARNITGIEDVLQLDSETRQTADELIQTMEFAV